MNTRQSYAHYKQPSWAPPAWLFGPVWTLLYAIIAVSYLYVGKLFFAHSIPFAVVLPFILNLVFNFLYIPIQFGLKKMTLASVDILLVVGTLAWSLIAIHQCAAWVTYVNIPYMAWVVFATVLQFKIQTLNS